MRPTSDEPDLPAARCPTGDPLAGTPYRLTAAKPIGRGGMGEVYAAEHIALGKPVVVKLLHASLAADGHLVERLRIEGQALATLAHPNLVAVTDLAIAPVGKRPYLVMERLNGRDLAKELKRSGPLPPLVAIDHVRQVLAGLAAAHRAGIVHRDIKLENVFLCDPDAGAGRVLKILDFGIAKILEKGPADGRMRGPRIFPTEDGSLVGTPRSTSPEQACGLPVDARADLYAVGILLYTLIAGKGPFAHIDDMVELLRAHAMLAPVLLSEAAVQPIPPELDAVLDRALAKNPARRFASAEAFSDELGAIASILRATRPASFATTEPAPVLRHRDAVRPPPLTFGTELLETVDLRPGAKAQERGLASPDPAAVTSSPFHAPLAPAAPPRFELRLFVVVAVASLFVFTLAFLVYLRLGGLR
jgi:eukaryotic-like serine/threonine-protein kinase